VVITRRFIIHPNDIEIREFLVWNGKTMRNYNPAPITIRNTLAQPAVAKNIYKYFVSTARMWLARLSSLARVKNDCCDSVCIYHFGTLRNVISAAFESGVLCPPERGN
jgi:hypothetical protein